jgi:hypothetical protein
LKKPTEIIVKLSQRDPSVRAGLAFSLGMTEEVCYGSES